MYNYTTSVIRRKKENVTNKKEKERGEQIKKKRRNSIQKNKIQNRTQFFFFDETMINRAFHPEKKEEKFVDRRISVSKKNRKEKDITSQMREGGVCVCLSVYNMLYMGARFSI